MGPGASVALWRSWPRPRPCRTGKSGKQRHCSVPRGGHPEFRPRGRLDGGTHGCCRQGPPLQRVGAVPRVRGREDHPAGEARRPGHPGRGRVSAERNKRQHDQASRVEITVRTKGPVVRAEAAAEDKPAAFDLALDKLMAQLRKAADRKRVHHGQRSPRSSHEAPPSCPTVENATGRDQRFGVHTVAGMEVDGDGPLVVREKVHPGVPMSLDQALLEMELVGHDFYLFIDVRAPAAQRGLPAQGVRLRRHPAGHARGADRTVAPAAARGGASVPFERDSRSCDEAERLTRAQARRIRPGRAGLRSAAADGPGHLRATSSRWSTGSASSRSTRSTSSPGPTSCRCSPGSGRTTRPAGARRAPAAPPAVRVLGARRQPDRRHAAAVAAVPDAGGLPGRLAGRGAGGAGEPRPGRLRPRRGGGPRSDQRP